MFVVLFVFAANPASAIVVSTGGGANLVMPPLAKPVLTTPPTSYSWSSSSSLSSSPEVKLATDSAELSIGSLVYEEVAFVDGVKTSVQSFSDLDKGVYSLTLTDFEFPEALSSLGVSVTSATDLVGSLLLGEQSNSETLLFEIDQPDTYYLSVFGIAGSTYNLGMYGLELSQIGVSAVPLPTAAYLFFSGLMGLVFVGRGEGLRFPHARWLGLR
jgi:hypothetical protein